MLGVGAYLLLLQTQHHGAVEGIEAGLYLVLLFVCPAVAQFHNEGQHLVILGVVERELRAFEQLLVQFYELLHHHLVYLQVSAFAASLLIYHVYQVAIPVGEFLFLVLVVVETRYVLAAQSGERASVSAYDVLHLPHIQQVFGNVFFS